MLHLPYVASLDGAGSYMTSGRHFELVALPVDCFVDFDWQTVETVADGDGADDATSQGAPYCSWTSSGCKS